MRVDYGRKMEPLLSLHTAMTPNKAATHQPQTQAHHVVAILLSGWKIVLVVINDPDSRLIPRPKWRKQQALWLSCAVAVALRSSCTLYVHQADGTVLHIRLRLFRLVSKSAS